MKISEICTRGIRSCYPDTDLAAAAAAMWDCDCGAVPVLDDSGKLVGIITDRDICIAVATRRRLASDIPVKEVMSGNVMSCRLEDSAKDALRIMREAQVRRLPILDAEGRLKGMVSVNDIILAVRDCKVKAVKEALLQDVILTLMAISQHRQPHAMQLADIRAMVPCA